MGSWGEQFSTGDQSRESRKEFANSGFSTCPKCKQSKIKEERHSAGCRMNGDGYGTTVFECLECKWKTSFQYDDASDVYYYETRGWKS